LRHGGAKVSWGPRAGVKLSGGGERGPIVGFSRAAKRRCLGKLQRVDWAIYSRGKHRRECRGAFVSLTWWQTWPGIEGQTASRKAFEKRLRRAWPVQGVVWICEAQKRGAPHYHLVVLFSADVDKGVLREWAAQAWCEVTGDTSVPHLIHGADTRGLYGGGRRLMLYLCKYVSKGGDDDLALGRRWGFSADVPIDVGCLLKLRRGDAVEFFRRLRKWGRGSAYLRGAGLTWRGLVLADFESVAHLLRGLGVQVCGPGPPF